MAQVFASQEQVVRGASSQDAALFLQEVARLGAALPGVRRRRRRGEGVHLRFRTTLLAPSVRLAVTAQPQQRDGAPVLVLRWTASVFSWPGGPLLEGDVINASGARYAIEGTAGTRNEQVLDRFAREAFGPAAELVQRRATARP